MTTEVFHKAARDGYLDLLRESTRKDCNKPDEDGMTPASWAAFYGNLDALRLIVCRGGDPDKCDIYGKTSLHCAAMNGHMNCVTFLVSFGTNMWALDNELHSALDLALLNNHQEVVKFLDHSIANQASLNKKVVKKLREKAMLDAQKRIKQLDKMQVKADKRAEREGKKLAKMREQMISQGAVVSKMPMPTVQVSLSPQGRMSPAISPRSVSPSTNGVPQGALVAPSTSKSSKPDLPAASISRSSSIRSAFQSIRNGSVRGSTRTNASVAPSANSFIIHDFSEPKPYSAHFYGMQKKGMLGGVAKKIKIKQKKQGSSDAQGDFKVSEQENGKRTVRSLTGLQRDFHVMYVRPENQEELESKSNDLVKSTSEPDFFSNRDSGIDSPESGTIEPASMFERPGFGSVAFISKRLKSSMIMSLPTESTDEDNTSSSIEGGNTASTNFCARVRRQASCTDSIGTVGSLARRMQSPGLESEESTSYAPHNYLSPNQSLEVFMVVNNVIEYLPMLIKEKIDLQALMLVSDSDLKEIGIPLGPRRKILSAINQHREFMKEPVKTTVL